MCFAKKCVENVEREREKVPLLVPVVVFAAGCYGGVQGWLKGMTALGCLFLSFALWTKLQKSQWQYPLLLVSLFFVGLLHSKIQWFWLNMQRIKEYKMLKTLKEPLYQGIIDNFPQKKNNTHFFHLKLQAIRMGEKQVPFKEKISCRIVDLHRELYLGQAIELRAKIVLPSRKRNPAEIDYYKLTLSKRLMFELLSEGAFLTPIPQRDRTEGLLIEAVRRKIKENLTVGIPEEKLSSLLCGMIYGDVAGLDQKEAEAFKQAGAYHLFAVSGQNVGILLCMGMFLLQGIGKNRWEYAFLFIPLLLIFSAVSGNGASVVRASIACIYCTVGWALKRKVSGLNGWSVSLFAFLIYDPLSVMDISLELSYAVVLSLLLLSKPLFNLLYYPFRLDPYIPQSLAPVRKRVTDKMGKIGAILFSTSLAAWLGALPCEFFFFHSLCWIGIFNNIIAVPIAEIIVFLGSISAIGGFFSCSIAVFFNTINRFFLWALIVFIDFSAKIPSGIIAVPDMKILRHPFDPWIYIAQADSGHLIVVKNQNSYWILDTLESAENEHLLAILQKDLFIPPHCPYLAFQQGQWRLGENLIEANRELNWKDDNNLDIAFKGNKDGQFYCLVNNENKKILILSYSLPSLSHLENLPCDLLIEHLLNRKKNFPRFSSFIKIYYDLSFPGINPWSLEKKSRTFKKGVWVFINKKKIQLETEN
ncbi:ComEC/Rec2 family competence protein [Methylacidiphilum caldifontis]|uniref:ComEC/Rec2 family competence protein n=1 Tax=Methylacidiphilum caldifontis TaxID=2795386 RepID=UPI001A8CAD71|nr:ComEC/Rec2 family competence protein [Methylacidiphilum caldifontis]QSR87973.1 ComEC/Rec2 family competence protein [Methylacidiphilum caldifontis]